MTNPLVDTKLVTKEIEYDEGQKMSITYRPLTRTVRNEILAKAIDAYDVTHPGQLGYDYTTLERELVKALLVSWELPTPPEVGWDMLSVETNLGDVIAETLGIRLVLESLVGKGPTVTEAKN